MKRAPHNRNPIQRGGQLTGVQAQEAIRQKEAKKAAKEASA